MSQQQFDAAVEQRFCNDVTVLILFFGSVQEMPTSSLIDHAVQDMSKHTVFVTVDNGRQRLMPCLAAVCYTDAVLSLNCRSSGI